MKLEGYLCSVLIKLQWIRKQRVKQRASENRSLKTSDYGENCYLKPLGTFLKPHIYLGNVFMGRMQRKAGRVVEVDWHCQHDKKFPSYKSSVVFFTPSQVGPGELAKIFHYFFFLFMHEIWGWAFPGSRTDSSCSSSFPITSPCLESLQQWNPVLQPLKHQWQSAIGVFQRGLKLLKVLPSLKGNKCLWKWNNQKVILCKHEMKQLDKTVCKLELWPNLPRQFELLMKS